MTLDRNIHFYFETHDAPPAPGAWPTPLDPANVAVIAVDMWQSHWSPYATARAAALAPMLNGFLVAARSLGMQIIHAPSNCGRYYENHPRLLALHEELYAPGEWDQAVTPFPPREKGKITIDKGSTWNERPWLYADFNPAGGESCKWYEDLTDEDGYTMEHYTWKGADHQNPVVVIEPKDLIVVDPFKCPNQNCPNSKPSDDYVTFHGDGHLHLAQYLRTRKISHLLYTGIHTNHCVVFARTYSMWPMSSFTYNKQPAIFSCALVHDLTDAFIHPRDGFNLTHASGVRAFNSWLSCRNTIKGVKDNANVNTGVIASTVSALDLLNFYNHDPLRAVTLPIHLRQG